MSYLLYSLCIVFVVIFDQITKMLAVKYLMPISSFPLIKDVFHLTYVENRGAAFGILQNHRWVFMVLSTVVMVVIIYVMFKYKRFFHPILMTGLSFTVGGGIGNMIDRTVNGFVVDFFDFTLIDFAVFNLADTFICIGVGLIFLDILLGKSDYSFLDDKKQIIDSEKDRNDDTDTDR
ncbi:MAG: signal peptidase II [Ruminococcaceae bacterium]|nr:signal peptidase II [Oscillospiraceae bacterium]